MAAANPRTSQALSETIPPWGVLVLESHHAPDFFMETRRHPFLKVIYFLSGNSHVHVEDTAFRCQRGDAVIVHPEQRNRIIDQSGAPVSLYALCLEPGLLAFDAGFMERLPRGLVVPGHERSRTLEAQLRRLRFQQQVRSADTPVSMVSLGLSVLIALHRAGATRGSEPAEERMDRYLKALETEFFEASTIDEAAARTGMSRRRFTSLFREKAGRTWLRHLQQLRIDHAARLLRESQLPVTSVAFECGFEDLSTFYRAFRKLRGCTPVEWRENGMQGG